MKLRIIWIGSNSDQEFREAIERYSARIRHFFTLEITELPSDRSRQKKNDVAIMHADSERLLSAIPSRGKVVVLDERGQQLDSLKFAGWLERTAVDDPNGITFVMGGDIGMNDAVRSRADKLLALSAMTLPHQVARVLLLEQIYRACTLMRNIPYHK